MATVVATAGAGLLVDAVWAVIIATVGILASLMILGWILVKTLQTVTQRQAGLIKQQARASAVLEASARDLTQVRRLVEGDSSKMTGEMRRVLEDLALASRSLTVPQAHFEQLLRSVSANTVRTEAALNDTLDEVRIIVNGVDSGRAEYMTSSEESVR
ncbi:MAG: hypothetical protein ACTHZ9_10570 [Leucobacter sp.]